MLQTKTNILNRDLARPKKRVFVGMSGGVDSSVSAALLIKAGYDVTGVFIKVWQPDWMECNWREERIEAMRAAAHLGIPFLTIDLEREYKRGVVDYMIAEYDAGRTPNPDVMCNREVKFGAFWAWAKSQGADFIATGHYAINDSARLYTSRDKEKDQTYFLWTLTNEDLKHVLFPVGNMTKDAVRKAARRFGLPNAEKKDSQGLCFIGKVDVKDFLSHYIKTVPGNVLDEKGIVVGTHPGARLFTIGERHGFVISQKTSADVPLYVIKKDINANTLTVARRIEHKDNKADNKGDKGCQVQRVSWVSMKAPATGSVVMARGRYRAPLQRAIVKIANESTATILFDEPIRDLAPGQSLVLYSTAGECLGGGVIA